MKKRNILASALALLVLTAGCSSTPSEDAAPAEETPAEEKEPEQTADLGPLFERGTVDGQSYVNDFFGFRGDFSNDWVIANDDELATMSQQTGESINNEIAKEKITDGSAILDFYGQSPRSGETVNIYMEDMGRLGMSADLLISANKSLVAKELEDQKFENVSVEKGTAVFLGQEVPCTRISAVYAGLDFYECQVYVINGRNIASITAASFNEDTTDAILAIFQPTE